MQAPICACLAVSPPCTFPIPANYPAPPSVMVLSSSHHPTELPLQHVIFSSRLMIAVQIQHNYVQLISAPTLLHTTDHITDICPPAKCTTRPQSNSTNHSATFRPSPTTLPSPTREPTASRLPSKWHLLQQSTAKLGESAHTTLTQF